MQSWFCVCSVWNLLSLCLPAVLSNSEHLKVRGIQSSPRPTHIWLLGLCSGHIFYSQSLLDQGKSWCSTLCSRLTLLAGICSALSQNWRARDTDCQILESWKTSRRRMPNSSVKYKHKFCVLKTSITLTILWTLTLLSHNAAISWLADWLLLKAVCAPCTVFALMNFRSWKYATNVFLKMALAV